MPDQVTSWQRYRHVIVGSAVVGFGVAALIRMSTETPYQAISGGAFISLFLTVSWGLGVAIENGDLRYWFTGNQIGRKRHAEKVRRIAEEKQASVRGETSYLGEAVGAAAVAAAIWYGGWALLVRAGAIETPVTLGHWWWGAVAYGAYDGLKALIVDLRKQGRYPEFFAFWGPYRTAAALHGVASGAMGIVAASAVLHFTSPEPPQSWVVGFVIVVTTVMVASGIFFGVTGVANKRREYPILAAPDIAFNGAFLGLFIGWVVCITWIQIRSEALDNSIFWTCLSIAAALGAAGNLWRRFSSGSVFEAFNVLADASSRVTLLLVGLWFSAIGGGVLWLTWRFTSGVVAYVGIGIGIYWLAKGLGPLFSALSWSRVSTGTHGKGRSATATELHRGGLIPRPNNAIYLGRFLDYGREGDEVGYSGTSHLITIGRTGSGKGTGVILPNLSMLRRSIIIIDPKGEAAAITARKRAQFGRVVMLNPFNILADKRPWMQSEGFNPLSTIRWDENFLDDCTIIGQSLVKQEKGGNGRFFSGSAHDLVTAVVMHEKLTRKDKANLANVRRMLTEEYAVDQRSGLPIGLAKTVFDMSESKFEPLRAKATRFRKDSKSNADVIRTAINETSFIDSPPVGKDLASTNDFRFADLKREIGTCYLVLPATHLESHSNWLRLIIASALRELLSTPPSTTVPPVLFMLDEFAQLGHLPVISNAMNVARGFGVQLWPFVQDLTQLKDIYDDRWENFLGASAALTAFAPRDVFTSDYLSRLSGNKTIIVERESEQSNSSGIGHGRGPEGVPLFRPEDLRRIPSRQMLCFVDGVKYPFMANAPGYWETEFSHRLDANPYQG